MAAARKGEAIRYFREVVLAYDGNECLPWPFAKNNKGYGLIKHKGRDKPVSRAVCEEVKGPPPAPGHEAAHSCGHGNDACCTKRHLSWKTHAENMADTLIHGTHNRGRRNGCAKLNENDVRTIRSLRGQMSQREIGAMFGVADNTISRIHTGKKWGWLE